VLIGSIAQLDELMSVLNPQSHEDLAFRLYEMEAHAKRERESEKAGKRESESARKQATRHPSLVTGHWPVFFVVGSGRSGTMFLADLLNESPEARIYHEPLQFADRAASVCAYRSQDFSRAYIERRKTFIESHFKGDGIDYYGEVNGYLSDHVDSLKSVFNAPVYLLVRDGRKVVRSIYSRYTYQGSHISQYFSPKKESPYFYQWENFSRFEKICWSWGSHNERYLTKIGKFIRFEDLISDWEEFNRVFNVHIPLNISKDVWSRLIVKPSNTTPAHQLPPYENWNDEQKKIFHKHCGKMMSRFGYDY